jgi:hypothetical protein
MVLRSEFQVVPIGDNERRTWNRPKRVLFYQADTGEIVSSWTFVRGTYVETAGPFDVEERIKKHVDELSRQYGRQIVTLEDNETKQLDRLSHRVEPKGRRLVKIQPRRDLRTP